MLDDLTFRVTELERRLANVMVKGTVVAADYAAGRVRVKSGDLTSDWLPWATLRAGQDRTWSAPDIGEQVIVVSPSGEPAAGVVLPALFSTAAPAPADKATVTRTVYGDGTVVEHDRETSAMAITLPAAGSWTLTVGPTVVEFSAAGMKLVAPDVDWQLGGGA